MALPQTDTLSNASRDNGPVISKWEQLALAPELLRSLSAFGYVAFSLGPADIHNTPFLVWDRRTRFNKGPFRSFYAVPTSLRKLRQRKSA